MSYAFVSLNGYSRSFGFASDTITATLLAGQRVLLGIYKDGAETVSSVTDDAGNVSTRLGADMAMGSALLSAWDGVIAANATTITVIYSATSTTKAIKLYLHQATGIDAAIAAQYAKADPATPGTGADGISSGTLTPAAQPGVLVGLVVPHFGTLSSSGTGFTDRGEVPVTGDHARVEDKVIAATSAVAATFTAASNLNFAALAVYWQLTAPPVPTSYAVHSDIYF
jgi:hypothetical protein